MSFKKMDELLSSFDLLTDADIMLFKTWLFFAAGKIQISSETKMLIDLAGGFVTEERGYVEIKVRQRGNCYE